MSSEFFFQIISFYALYTVKSNEINSQGHGGGFMRLSLIKGILTDIHFWVPFMVLLIGIILLINIQ